MAAPSAITLYQSFKAWIGDGTFDMDGSSFRAALVTSAYTPSAAHSLWSDVSANEVASGTGYTTGGYALTGLSYTQTSGTAKWTAGNPTWTASGGSITARYLVIYALGTLNTHVNPLVGYMLLDSAPADVVTATGNTLTVQWNASGIFTLT